MKSICVFCGSSRGAKPAYLLAAQELGRSIARRKIRLVYGGASVGLMGAVADAALMEGGEVLGVIPDRLMEKEIAHVSLTEMRQVSTLSERKDIMAAQSNAFIAMPGGFGTLDEIFEVITWSQLGIHKKVSGFLNTDGYYDTLLRFLDETVKEGFVPSHMRDAIRVSSSVDNLLDQLSSAGVVDAEKKFK